MKDLPRQAPKAAFFFSKGFWWSRTPGVLFRAAGTLGKEVAVKQPSRLAWLFSALVYVHIKGQLCKN